MFKDQRGKHERVSKFTTNDRETIVADINSRKMSVTTESRKYKLSSDLNV